MDAFANALTVIGAHAVHVWVQDAFGLVGMQATRDADIAVNPTLIAPDPKLLDVMSAIGVAPTTPDRPGIYGYHTEATLPFDRRTTIDLLVPEIYAGLGRRTARIEGQKNAASRAVGLELTIWDRHRKILTALDDPIDQIEAWIAGPASLLVAKAHKVHERLAQADIRPNRLRPKDSGDVALLMMVSSPANVARVMAEQSVAHPEIAPVVTDAADWLVEMYSNSASQLRQHAVSVLSDRIVEDKTHEAISGWLAGFQDARGEES